jgi:hypothetical protein
VGYKPLFEKQRLQPGPLTSEWGHFLTRFAWLWFVTLTFRHAVSAERVRQCYRNFFNEIRNSGHSLGWFAVQERGVLGRLHVHALLAGAKDLKPREWESVWFKLAGTAVFDRYDPSRGCAYYCAKQLHRSATEFDLSDNLNVFAKAQTAPINAEPKESDHGVCAANCESAECRRATCNDLQTMTVLADENPEQASGHDGDRCAQADNQSVQCMVSNSLVRSLTRRRARRSTSCHTPGTRLESVHPGRRIRAQGGCMDREIASASLEREAAAKDQQLRSHWSKVKTAVGNVRKAMLEFGKLCREMRAKELHRYVQKPGSRKGYVCFEEYVETLTGGEVTRGKLYVAIALPGLTEGPNALTPDDIAEMPQANAIELTRLPSEERTPELVELAKRTSKRDFPAKVQQKLNEKLPPEQQKTPRAEFFCKLHPMVKNKLEETIERFTKLPVVRDGDRALSLKEKAVFAMCNAAEQFASEDLALIDQKMRRKAVKASERIGLTPNVGPESQAVRPEMG